MNILPDWITNFLPFTSKAKKMTPAEFRRMKKHNVIGYSIDHNSKHIGKFKGNIVPMKRRFKGVSRKGEQ